ncbi:response regulator transcription factor [Caproiciproducens galactitolivorans]|uniref:Stage 0 sporulation protein A homolog n=1 Tax=Caproiciproducens galactitolivorans TaxID=642589 RepID=A0ABT4BS77_9FIRM|nr:helix-turn-helix domain-containing protein [Caproiciproducens galactitolivorans]MCY1713751.1 helix-turn-helix domain-containing protein [Caproiciproducens galactitolivorans]
MYKVLLVEDEDIIRKGLMFMMNWAEYGCTIVSEAVNGKDGLDKIAGFRPDIVITDVKMPFLDGIEMLKKSIEEYGFEAIILSGYSEFDYAKEAVSLGVTEYLLKPLDMDLLGKALKKTAAKIAEKGEIEAFRRSRKIAAETDILLAGMACRNHQSKYGKEMLDYIDRHYCEKISISDLCGRLNVSVTYLNAKFKEETNYTFNDFLNRYRIVRAVKMLKDSDMKVYEIAEAVGFQDYKYFIQVFKKYIGCSPIKFVNALEKGGNEATQTLF